MQLSTEERQAVQAGKSVRCVEHGSRQECVVLRADLFERMRYLFDLDPSALIGEMDHLLANFEPGDWKEAAEWKAPSSATLNMCRAQLDA